MKVFCKVHVGVLYCVLKKCSIHCLNKISPTSFIVNTITNLWFECKYFFPITSYIFYNLLLLSRHYIVVCLMLQGLSIMPVIILFLGLVVCIAIIKKIYILKNNTFFSKYKDKHYSLTHYIDGQ